MTPYHHGDLRAELLRHAAGRIEEAGAAGLSLRELARDAGVSHAAPRQHFPDKQALLDALAVSGLERLGRRLDTALRDPGEGFDERLTRFARAYVRFATQNRELLALMFARKDAPRRHGRVARRKRGGVRGAAGDGRPRGSQRRHRRHGC